MEERKVTITLGSTELEVYAGNMALLRYRRAGGSMARLELIDKLLPSEAPEEEEEPELPPLSHDEMFDAAEIAGAFLHANLIRDDLAVEDLFNLSGAVSDLVGGYIKAACAMPWLFGSEADAGELVEEDTTDSSTTGPSPSSSSDGIQTVSGKSEGQSSG